MQSHLRRLHACLAVTCHLHFWQNDRDLLRATVVTRWWNDDLGLNVLICRVWNEYLKVRQSGYSQRSWEEMIWLRCPAGPDLATD